MPSNWKVWLDMNESLIWPVAIAGSLTWIAIAMTSESYNIKGAFRKYFRPDVRFMVSSNHVEPQLTIINGQWAIDGILLIIEGVLSNNGGMPTTVVSIETEVRKGRWWFNRVRGKTGIPSAIREKGREKIVDARGYLMQPFSVSPCLDITAIARTYKLINPEDLDDGWVVMIKWNTMGQALREIVIRPDWDGFQRIANELLSRPVPDTKDSLNGATE